MQLLCLLIFIGATQCDDSSEIPPDSFDNLGVPDAQEYVSQLQLSVQSSYITSVECMLSSNHYIQSGFSEIDSSSNNLEENLVTKFKDGFSSMENMMLGFQQTDEEKESQDKINAVVSMTVNYYQKKDVTVEKCETKLSEVTEVHQAQSILTARWCESSYIDFMNDVTTIKTKYTSGTSGTSDADKMNTNQWATQVNQYYDARESIINKTNVYASIREAFLFGSGINLCEGSANTDQSLLKIYETDDLSKFFGKTDNDASALLCQTVTQMYTIYKSSLTNIYLKSVVHSNCDLAMRVTIWEQVNLVRANFEYMSQNIVSFIKTTQTDAESSFGADSEEYKKIMITLYTCVNKMLLTVVKTTEIHYKRALNFKPDRSMIKMDFNKYKVDTIENYYDNIAYSGTNIDDFDMRIVDKGDCSYPSPQMCIPQNMYSLLVNRLVLQTFICQLNYIDVRRKTTKYDVKNVDSWIYEKITMVQFQNSIIFSKCTAIVNKMFIMNCATYTYVLLITDQSTQTTDVQQIIDQSTTDVIGTLCVNVLEITDTYNTVEIFVDKNSNTNDTSVVYRPGQPRNSNTPPPGNYPTNNGSYPTNNGNPAPNNGNPAPSNGNPPPKNGNPPSYNGGYPTNNGSPPPNSGNYSKLESPTNNYPSNGNNQYSFIISSKPITKIIEIIRSSPKNKITSCLTNVQSAGETEYTKVVIKSLEICQQITQYNADYLEIVTSDSLKYLSEVTTPDSADYYRALIIIFRDTQEKSKILFSTMVIPLKRTTSYSLTSDVYLEVPQTMECKDFVNNIYKYFEVNIEEVYNNDNDADLYLQNSMTQFNKIYETVVKAVKETQDDSYKTFLLCYLEKTIAVYKQTTNCFKEQIVQSQQFISQREDSKCAFYKEITQRMDSINIMYYGVLIKSYQYAKNTSSVSIFVSEFDVITTQTEIVTSYTTITHERTLEFSVAVSN